MKEKPLTRDDIFMAADIVASTHVMPTITNVRELLGRGSETTLLKFLREWKEVLIKTYAKTIEPQAQMTRPYEPQPEPETQDIWREHMKEVTTSLREMLQD